MGFENNDTVDAQQVINCAKDQIFDVGVSVYEVDECVKNSFMTPGDNTTDNILYFHDKLLAEVYGISMHPAITING